MPDPSFISLLARLWRHLSRRRQVQLVLLLGIMVASGLSEVISLGAVMPFIAILTAPDKVFNMPLVQEYATKFKIIDPSQLVFPVTVAFAIAAIGAAAIRLIMLWLSTRLAFSIGTDLSVEIYRRTLYQPYKVHVSRNSSQVISGITTKAWNVVTVLQSILLATSSAIIGIFIILTLLIIDPLVISIAAAIIGICYGLVTCFCRKRLKVNSEIMARESTQILKALQEGLGGIRDVLLNGSQKVYCQTYIEADVPLKRAYGNTAFLSTGPRFVMEAVGMVLIAGLAYGLSLGSGGIAAVLPLLGALALGAQRLLPVVQLVYSNWVMVVAHRMSLIDTLDLLDQPVLEDSIETEPSPLNFKECIVFKNVRFKYLPDSPWVLDGVNLTIRKGSRIGLVGSTGGGKSTLMDLLMGLLEPTEGVILVDGIPINDLTRRAWQKCIAHVPQNIFLSDATMTENIAFGVPKTEIDVLKVIQAAEKAQVAQFVEGRRNGYQTLVGERGIMLSGGQRQRIGIARALYKDASVLIFDEATSSLDNSTEKAVIESISALSRELTILMTAHRLTTVKQCDEIVELEMGRVVAQGTYDELINKSPSFKRMATATL